MMLLFDHFRKIDPTYGSQTHQREFLLRMERAQQSSPCRKDHEGETPPTHRTRCYPVDRRGRMVGT